MVRFCCTLLLKLGVFAGLSMLAGILFMNLNFNYCFRKNEREIYDASVNRKIKQTLEDEISIVPFFNWTFESFTLI